jgi:uncharacterized protein
MSAQEGAVLPPADPETGYRILAVDGGGIRGLIPALVLQRLEELIREHDPDATLASCFDLVAGTSTGGLIAIGITAPGADGRPRLDANGIVDLYRGADARKIFGRPPRQDLPPVALVHDLFDPKYSSQPLREVLTERFGDGPLADALKPTMVSSYDMHERQPKFFKSWRDDARTTPRVDAGLATSAAPTYFPAEGIDRGAAYVDGGVFVNNPALAAVIEAVKDPGTGPLPPKGTFVVSLGTGRFEPGFEPKRVAGWGQLGWVLPKKGEAPMLGVMLDGQSDAADHWTHFMLNHEPGEEPARGDEIGRGPRYFRFQAELPRALPLDGVREQQLRQVEASAQKLIETRQADLEAVAATLAQPRSPR